MLLRNQTVPEILQPLALNCSATRLPTPLNLPPIDSQRNFTDASKVRHYHWDRTHKASPRIYSSKRVHSASELQSIQWLLVQHKCNFFTHMSVDRYRVQEAKITSRKRAVPVTAPVNLWGKNQIGPKTLGLGWTLAGASLSLGFFSSSNLSLTLHNLL